MALLRSLVLAGAIAVALSGCAGSALVGPAPSDRQGQTFTGSLTVQGVSVPLPPGPWTAGPDASTHPDATRIVLTSTHAGVIDRLVYVSVDRTGDTARPFRRCDDPAYLYAADAGIGEVRRCWHIRAISLGTLGDPAASTLALRRSAQAQQLFLPATMIGPRYQFADRQRRIVLEYYWNPDLIAPAPNGAVWLPEEWSRASVATDPARSAVAARLRDWAADWYADVRAGLRDTGA